MFCHLIHNSLSLWPTSPFRYKRDPRTTTNITGYFSSTKYIFCSNWIVPGCKGEKVGLSFIVDFVDVVGVIEECHQNFSKLQLNDKTLISDSSKIKGKKNLKLTLTEICSTWKGDLCVSKVSNFETCLGSAMCQKRFAVWDVTRQCRCRFPDSVWSQILIINTNYTCLKTACKNRLSYHPEAQGSNPIHNIYAFSVYIIGNYTIFVIALWKERK